MSDHAERDRFENEGSFSHPFAAPSASEPLTRLVEPEGSLDTSRCPKGWTQGSKKRGAITRARRLRDCNSSVRGVEKVEAVGFLEEVKPATYA